mmetsp:Transcript_23885/g.76806  ORF Transcript_23885/g.76806 Transcript_23885/m.76806 type:complete len:289 (-) Transcript_23885:1301-2167(-)
MLSLRGESNGFVPSGDRSKVDVGAASWQMRGFAATATHIGVSILLKLMLGSDDLVWLAPFMARPKTVSGKSVVGMKYVSSVVSLTLLACALAVIVQTAARQATNSQQVDEIISTVAAGLLIAYSIYLAHDEGYFRVGRQDDDDDAVSLAGPLDAPLVSDVESTDDLGRAEDDSNSTDRKDDDARSEAAPVPPPSTKKKKDDNGVIVVAFLGSLDDFMVYFTLALSAQLQWYELSIGIALGSVVIAAAVGTLLQSSEGLAGCIERIPVPLILLGLAALILVAAWTGLDL